MSYPPLKIPCPDCLEGTVDVIESCCRCDGKGELLTEFGSHLLNFLKDFNYLCGPSEHCNCHGSDMMME